MVGALPRETGAGGSHRLAVRVSSGLGQLVSRRERTMQARCDFFSNQECAGRGDCSLRPWLSFMRRALGVRVTRVMSARPGCEATEACPLTSPWISAACDGCEIAQTSPWQRFSTSAKLLVLLNVGRARKLDKSTKCLQIGIFGRLAQLGEHQLDKLGVTGSSPVAPITATPGTTPYPRTERGPGRGLLSLFGKRMGKMNVEKSAHREESRGCAT